MSDVQDYSLASLAEIDVAQIEDLRFETLPMGIYTFEVTSADIAEGQNGDGDKRFVAEIVCKIVEVKSVLAGGVDKESLVGKTITDKYFITPPTPEVQALGGRELEEAQRKFVDAVRRLKTAVKDMGGATEGNLIDATESVRGLFFTAKIAHRADRDDKSVQHAQLRLTPVK